MRVDQALFNDEEIPLYQENHDDDDEDYVPNAVLLLHNFIDKYSVTVCADILPE